MKTHRTMAACGSAPGWCTPIRGRQTWGVRRPVTTRGFSIRLTHFGYLPEAGTLPAS